MSHIVIIVCDVCRSTQTPSRFSMEEAESEARNQGFIRPRRPVYEHVCGPCAFLTGEAPA